MKKKRQGLRRLGRGDKQGCNFVHNSAFQFRGNACQCRGYEPSCISSRTIGPMHQQLHSLDSFIVKAVNRL